MTALDNCLAAACSAAVGAVAGLRTPHRALHGANDTLWDLLNADGELESFAFMLSTLETVDEDGRGSFSSLLQDPERSITVFVPTKQVRAHLWQRSTKLAAMSRRLRADQKWSGERRCDEP